MLQITVGVEGMQCPMCEAHVNEAVRNAFCVESVTVSHKKKSVTILTKNDIDEQELKSVIEETGYSAGTVEKAEQTEKKGLFSLFRK